VTVAARHLQALTHIDPAEGDRVLEVGCGHGVTASLVLERLTAGGTLTAIDRSPTMVAMATARNRAAVDAGRLTVVCGEVGPAPVPGGPYDLAYALNVRALWTPGPALDAVRAVLVSGGRLVLHAHGPDPDGPGRV
jgi:SAM-dependent methyltransferase